MLKFCTTLVSSATRAMIKGKKKKTKVLQVFQLQRSRSAATFYGIQKQRHQVGSPRTEHLKIKTRVVGLYMVDIQGTRCDFQ